MAKFPALPNSVDRYVREFLNRLAGRTGNAGDRAVLQEDLVELGLAIEKGQKLSQPVNLSDSISDILKPINGVELPDNPTSASGLSAAGTFGAVILQWNPASYKGHSHTEVWRAQIDDREQASMVHEAPGSRYADVTGNTLSYYYWVRYANEDGQVGGFNALNGVMGAGTAGTEHIQEQVKGAIDKSYFTPGWASHNDDQEASLSEAHDRIDTETASRTAAIHSEQTARVNADSVLGQQVDTVVADLSTETLNRTAAVQSEVTARINGDSALAADITSLTSTVGQNTASITTQQTVTDGLKAEYTLKVQQENNGQITVAGIGVASGQAEDGEPFSEIAFAAENFFFTTPNGLVHPMAIVNAGTEAAPDYKIMLDAGVLINGHLSISQLQSGELQNGTALTVGQGSIEMSTASDGYGQIIITGAGGIATNDYLVIKEGRIESFVYTTSAGHVRYKEVRRNESGSATSGQQVTIPAYFKSQPVIHLAPRDISIYNASYPSQSQRLELEHSAVLPHPDIEGAWVFTPYCRLLLSDGGKTVANGLTYYGGNSSQRWEVTGVNSLKKVTVNSRAASSRHTGSGNSYQNRKVTMALEYRPAGGSWASGGSVSVDISQFNTHALQVSKSLSQGTYDIAVVLTSQDRSGTFTSGALEYDYSQANKSGSNWSKVLESPPGKYVYHQSYSQNISIGNPGQSGWEITRIDYSARVQFTIKARTTFDGSWIMNGKVPGEAYIEVPDGAGGVRKYRVYSDTNEPVDYVNWRAEDSGDITVNWSDSTYKDGNIKGPVKLYITKTGYTYSSMNSDDNYLPTAYASVTVSDIHATVYYRKAKGQTSAATNTFYWDSSSYDLGATDISLTDSIIHWTATGE